LRRGRRQDFEDGTRIGVDDAPDRGRPIHRLDAPNSMTRDRSESRVPSGFDPERKLKVWIFMPRLLPTTS